MRIRMKFSANLGFLFTEASSILEQYQLAKASGFKAVEHPFPHRGVDQSQLLKIKEETGLNVALVNIELDDEEKFGCASIPGKQESFREHLKNTINFAKAFNCKKIHLMSGIIENPPSNEHRDTFISNLKYAVTQLEPEEIVGVIEPINFYSLPGYFLNDYKFAIDTIKAIGSNNLKLMVDIFHMQMICGNISNNLKDFAPYIGHVQIAQAPNRNEPSTDGELNYRFILKQLASSGYDDFIGLEYKPLNNTVEGLKWIEHFGYALTD